MATCFDSIESSSGLLKNRYNVSKFVARSGIPNAFGIPKQIPCTKTDITFWDPKRVWDPITDPMYQDLYCILGSQTRLGSQNRSNVSRFILHSGIPNAFGTPKQSQCIKIYIAFWDPKRVWDPTMHYKSWYIGSVLQKAWW